MLNAEASTNKIDLLVEENRVLKKQNDFLLKCLNQPISRKAFKKTDLKKELNTCSSMVDKLRRTGKLVPDFYVGRSPRWLPETVEKFKLNSLD